MAKGGLISQLSMNDLVTLFTTKPRVAQSIESLMSSLSVLLGSRIPKTLMICSTQPREGKTTVSASLGIAFALTRRDAVLVDADLRRPRVHEVFDIDESPGLAEVLRGDAAILPVIRKVALPVEDDELHPALDVIPAGTAKGMEFTTIEPERLTAIVDELTASHESVIFDAPPVLATSDALHLAPLVDGVVFVVDSGTVPEREAKVAKQRLEKAGGKILGFVLNRFDERRHGQAYLPYHDYYRARR